MNSIGWGTGYEQPQLQLAQKGYASTFIFNWQLCRTALSVNLFLDIQDEIQFHINSAVHASYFKHSQIVFPGTLLE